jgi:hypothetical protein
VIIVGTEGGLVCFCRRDRLVGLTLARDLVANAGDLLDWVDI